VTSGLNSICVEVIIRKVHTEKQLTSIVVSCVRGCHPLLSKTIKSKEKRDWPHSHFHVAIASRWFPFFYDCSIVVFSFSLCVHQIVMRINDFKCIFDLLTLQAKVVEGRIYILTLDFVATVGGFI